MIFQQRNLTHYRNLFKKIIRDEGSQGGVLKAPLAVLGVAAPLFSAFFDRIDMAPPFIRLVLYAAVFLNGKAVTGPVKIAKAGNYHIEARF